MRHFLIGLWEFTQIIIATLGFVATIFGIMGIIGIIHVMLFK